MICQLLLYLTISCSDINIREDILLINSLRKYDQNHTSGKVFINGEYFGHSLEDAGRPIGVKIQDETAIPEGTYKAQITYSHHFKREMIVLYNVDDDHSIERHGVRFTGIRVHGGNTVSNTSGCVLVAENSDNNGKIWGSLETELTGIVQDALDAGEDVYWIISEAA